MLLEVVYLQVTLLYTFKELIVVKQYSLLATILNLKNNPILILTLRRQLTLKEFNLLALALTSKGRLSGSKNYNDFNEVDTNNILSFIDYTTIDK